MQHNEAKLLIIYTSHKLSEFAAKQRQLTLDSSSMWSTNTSSPGRRIQDRVRALTNCSESIGGSGWDGAATAVVYMTGALYSLTTNNHHLITGRQLYKYCYWLCVFVSFLNWVQTTFIRRKLYYLLQTPLTDCTALILNGTAYIMYALFSRYLLHYYSY